MSPILNRSAKLLEIINSAKGFLKIPEERRKLHLKQVTISPLIVCKDMNLSNK